jgi:hypothetical protein
MLKAKHSINKSPPVRDSTMQLTAWDGSVDIEIQSCGTFNFLKQFVTKCDRSWQAFALAFDFGAVRLMKWGFPSHVRDRQALDGINLKGADLRHDFELQASIAPHF